MSRMMNKSDIVLPWFTAQKRAEERYELKAMLSQQRWWKEVAGIFLLCPRQVGKTTSLRDAARWISKKNGDNGIVSVCPNLTMRNNLAAGDIRLVQNTIYSMLSHVNVAAHILIMDEFMYLNPEVLDYLLSLEWKSVIAVGSMK